MGHLPMDLCKDFMRRLFSTLSSLSRRSLFSFCISFRSFFMSSESLRASANSDTALKKEEKIDLIEIAIENLFLARKRQSPIRILTCLFLDATYHTAS